MQDVLLIDHRENTIIVCIAFFNMDQLHMRMQSFSYSKGAEFIINIDGNACPFINTMVGEDATNFVKEKLQIPFDVTQ
jgi:hypothetical protein